MLWVSIEAAYLECIYGGVKFIARLWASGFDTSLLTMYFFLTCHGIIAETQHPAWGKWVC